MRRGKRPELFVQKYPGLYQRESCTVHKSSRCPTHAAIHPHTTPTYACVSCPHRARICALVPGASGADPNTTPFSIFSTSERMVTSSAYRMHGSRFPWRVLCGPTCHIYGAFLTHTRVFFTCTRCSSYTRSTTTHQNRGQKHTVAHIFATEECTQAHTQKHNILGVCGCLRTHKRPHYTRNTRTHTTTPVQEDVRVGVTRCRATTGSIVQSTWITS